MLFGPGVSTTDTDLFRTIENTARRHYPGAKVVPSVVGGFTDSHFFRDLGIVSYGHGPFVLQPETSRTFHGNNEHIPVDTFEKGVEMMTEIVTEFAGARNAGE